VRKVRGVLEVLGVLGVPAFAAKRLRRGLAAARIVMILAGAGGLGVRAVHAQAPPAAAYVGKPVASVALSVEGRATTDPALLDAVQVKPNQPLSMSDVRETMTHLYTLGRFDDVQVEAEGAANGGVAITIRLAPVHVVTKVEFRGALGLSEGELRDRMAIRFGSTPPAAKAGDVAADLQQFYAERGYLSATVTPAPPAIFHDPDRATLAFDITAGPRVRIARAQITGQPLEPAEKIEERLRIAPGAPYQPGDLRERLASYVTRMRRSGRYEADAHELAPKYNADRTEVDVTVEVHPGPAVTVQFTGDPLPPEKRAELVPIEREGSVDEDMLEDAARRITDYLQEQGYWKADVGVPERKDEEGKLTIVFDVRRGPLFRVAPGGLQITGTQAFTLDELRTGAKLTEVKLAEGDPFIASKIAAVESAIRQFYRERGFATVAVESQPNQAGANLVEPRIVVTEGPRVLIGSVTTRGNDTVPAQKLLEQANVKTGSPYYGPELAAARDRVEALYLNLGFQSADVTVPAPTPVVEGAAARADVVFQIREGVQTTVEHIFITGNVKTNATVIRRELRLTEGEPLGQEALADSRRNLAALGLFRRIQISAVSHGDPARSDLIVTVEESQRTTVDYGGGAQVEYILRKTDITGAPIEERIEFAPRGFFEIGRRNLGGRNRSLNLYTRFGLRPSTDPSDSNPFGFSEYRVVSTYREPRAFRNFGELTGTGAIEQGVRTGFNFVRKGGNAELSRQFKPGVRVSGQYAFTKTRIFDEVLTEKEKLSVDRVFSRVRLSMFSGAISRDTRDDLIAAQHGTLLSANGTLAGRVFGSEVGFVKLFMQSFYFRNLGKRNVVFAGGARLGLSRAAEQIKDGELVQDLPASERFYAGGDTTIRGFARDAVGTPQTLTIEGFPKGGQAEIVLNAELRIPVAGDFGAVVFADGGNVFARVSDLDLGELRAGLGFGARYRSPFGPIRLDFGFPVHPIDRRPVHGSLEKMQIYFSMGHAF
jgi:outer membrane protein insertion porin family